MTSPENSGERVVIVGGSAAGLSVADGLREAGFDGQITVFNAESHHPYDRPSLSKSLLSHSNSGLLELRTPEHLRDARIELNLGQQIVGLDVDRRYIITDHGAAVPWDHLVIACGARARTLHNSQGTDLPVLRDANDLHKLLETTDRYDSIGIIGSGLIGMETAAALAERGIDVSVFGDATLPLAAQLGDAVATSIRAKHVAHGVRIHGGVSVESVEGDSGAYTLQLSDGTSHQLPNVLVAIGVRPNTEWLRGSGVVLDDGVLTDSAGRTNVPGVWAVGDVATVRNEVSKLQSRAEHWLNAIERGRQVGINIALSRAEPHVGVPFFWTEQFGTRYQCYGRLHRDDQSLVVLGDLAADNCLVLYGGADGKLSGVVAWGRTPTIRHFRNLLRTGGSWQEALQVARSTSQEVPEHGVPV